MDSYAANKFVRINSNLLISRHGGLTGSSRSKLYLEVRLVPASLQQPIIREVQERAAMID